jgi:hypothetical protein
MMEGNVEALSKISVNTQLHIYKVISLCTQTHKEVHCMVHVTGKLETLYPMTTALVLWNIVKIKN